MKKLNLLLSSLLIVVTPSLSYGEDLLTIYQQALEADPKVKAAQLQVMVGEAQTGQALSQMLPQVTASANWSTNKQRIKRESGYVSDNYPGTRYVISLNQSLIDLAKFWNWRRSLKVEDQLNAENIDALNKLIYDVTDRYFAALEADDQLFFSQSETQATQKQLEQMQKQFAKQLIKITDLYMVEAKLDRNQAEELEAAKNLAVAKEKLVQLTGKMPENLQKLAHNTLFKPIGGKIEDWIEVAKSQNPQILAKSSAVEAADDNVTVQQSKNLPVVDLQLNYYSTNTGYQSSNIGETETQVAAINVNVPIFSGGETWHQMKEAQHKLALSKYDREDVLRNVEKETRDAFLSTNANYRRIQAIEKAVRSATKSREAMEKGFAYRVQTMSDVLDAQQTEFKMQKELSKAKYSYLRNKIRFFYAVGTIGEENLQEINHWLQKSTIAAK